MKTVFEEMFFIRRPSLSAIDVFLSSQGGERFSYSEIGSTRNLAPAGYAVDHNRVPLGHGNDVFQRAVQSLQVWRMFDLGWVELFPKNAPIEPNATVAVLIHHFGFWSLNACRVIYVLQDERSFGFAYGTLQDHAEQGEERFLVSWSEDDSVWYDILAFSRPREWQAKVARPMTRMLQRRFAKDSKAAMTVAVRHSALRR
jgi:uncharacterized protein (UPF0548 family)